MAATSTLYLYSKYFTTITCFLKQSCGGMNRLLLVCVLLLLLLISPIDRVECKKEKKRSKRSKSINDSSDVNDTEAKIEFKDERDLQNKINEYGRENIIGDDELTEAKLAGLKADEKNLRVNLVVVQAKYGDVSREKAKALHKLGLNTYKQKNFEEAVAIGQEILRITEQLDGVGHLNTALALNNVANALWLKGEKILCHTKMSRALNILIKVHGAESKQVLLHRGKMLSFQVPDAKHIEGLSYEDYLDEL